MVLKKHKPEILVVATKGDLLDQRRKLHIPVWAIIFIILK
jgi:hypothetical protein